MKTSRNTKNSGKHRMNQQPWRPSLKSSWPTIYSDNDMATFLAALTLRGTPLSYSADNVNYSQKSALKSRPVIRSLGDTDTEDEGYSNRQWYASVSNQRSYNIRRHATSMESLTSYSSLGERSSTTSSPLEDSGFKHSLSIGILDLDFCDYDQDPIMREAVEEIVSPKPAKKRIDTAASLAAMDPSILVALPGPKGPEVPRYLPTALCDLTVFLAGENTFTETDNAPRDLDQFRLGTLPVNDDEESLTTRGWDIPVEKEDEILVGCTKIPYRKLSEMSDTGDDCWPLPTRDLSLLSSSSTSEIESRSSSQSGDHDSFSLCGDEDSSDYMGDISGEETFMRHVSYWPPRKKVNLDLKLEDAVTPFALSPRIPGVEYYGAPTSVLTESPGRISRGLDAFFNSRSVVHRLGPHGCEQVYEMVACPERCGFAYPVPSKQITS